MDLEAEARTDVEQTLREGRRELEHGVAIGRFALFALLAVLAGAIVGIREHQPWPALVFGLDTLYAFAIWRRGERVPVVAVAHLDPLLIAASAIALKKLMGTGGEIHGLAVAALFDMYCLGTAFALLLFLCCVRVEGRGSRVVLTLYTMALYWIAIRVDVGEFMPQQILAGLLVGAGGLLGSASANRIGELVNRQARLSLLRRYVPQPFVDRVSDDSIDPMTLMAPQSLEVTMMVADLRGFTAMSEKMAPEDVVAMLGEYHTAMLGAVEASGGTVDKFLGDGILVVFGLPRPGSAAPDDHGAAAAVQCAAGMLFRLDTLNATRAETGKPALAMGIGIHTGPVLAGTIGAGARREFTVIGDAVNTASRLEGLTKGAPSPVLVSAATVSRLGAGVASSTLRELEPMPIRGKSEPLRIYALERGSRLLRIPRPA